MFDVCKTVACGGDPCRRGGRIDGKQQSFATRERSHIILAFSDLLINAERNTQVNHARCFNEEKQSSGGLASLLLLMMIHRSR